MKMPRGKIFKPGSPSFERQEREVKQHLSQVKVLKGRKNRAVDLDRELVSVFPD